MNNSYLTNAMYNAGIYIRLSQEDRDKKYESDSESVLNQRQILTEYVNNQGFNLVDEYIDDGYSGTTFDRPGFERMITDIQNKKINLVIVKDLSRLGRDHVKTGYYIETFFPENKVRFISIMESYDSIKNQASNDSSTFIIACNDYYSKQNSLKIRNVLDEKRKNGKFIGSAPCYGYKRDENDKGHLIPDHETAPVVKQIFEWRLNDVGVSEIASRLTKMGIKTPAGYKNLKYSSRLKEKDIWTIHSVIKILSNRMYTGDMVQHKQTKVNYKSKKKVALDEKLWLVVENTHEPLVDKEIFNAIHNKKTSNNRSIKIKTDRKKRLLEGLLYCHECGNRLGVLYRKNHDYWTINCNRYARDPIRKRCYPHFFPYEYFESQVLNNLYSYVKGLFSALDINELNEEIIKRTESETFEIKDNIKNLESEKKKLLASLETLYNDRIAGNVSIDAYKQIAISYENKISVINSKIEELNNQMTNKSTIKNIPNYTNKIRNLLDIKNPTRELLFTIIEKIEVDKDRNITLKFRYNILNDLSFRYEEINKIRNPYGRYGKIVGKKKGE